MRERFEYFVVLAEMRTGSNLLEERLNAFPSLTCHGEAFNPHFVGYPKRDQILGFDLNRRERDPVALLRAIKAADGGIHGFRFFHDHDPRALDHFLNDPVCAKVILTRNPVDSYISWKIARETGQWKLTNVKHRKETRIRFDPGEYDTRLDAHLRFRSNVRRTLQTSGQVAFQIAYEDLGEIDVINGLAAFLGERTRLPSLPTKLKKQNPEDRRNKVINFDEMQVALAHRRALDEEESFSFEKVRGPGVREYVVGPTVPLVFMPINGVRQDHVRQWLAKINVVELDGLRSGLNQKELRIWKRENPGHRSFTIVDHPVERAHAAFYHEIRADRRGANSRIHASLQKLYGISLPEEDSDEESHYEGFLTFLKFLKSNLAGQTGIKVKSTWASQAQSITAMSRFAAPDMIIRQETLTDGLQHLAEQVGSVCPAIDAPRELGRFPLADIYDDKIEAAARAVYHRDYTIFGFGAWR